MNVLGANYLIKDTSQKFALASLYFDEKTQAWFQYAKAAEAISAYAVAKLVKDGTAVGCTTTVSGAEPTAIGIPQVALAINEYGWFFVEGGIAGNGILVLALTLCATAAQLYTTATLTPNCAVDDTATDLISGLVLNSTNATGGTVATECRAVGRLATNN
jgi:hypothetical protein